MTEAERERNKIMNEFYSIEMEDMARTEEDEDIIQLNSGLKSTREKSVEEEKTEDKESTEIKESLIEKKEQKRDQGVIDRKK